MPSTPVPVPVTTSTPNAGSTNSQIKVLPSARTKETSTSIEVYSMSEAMRNTKNTSTMKVQQLVDDGMYVTSY